MKCYLWLLVIFGVMLGFFGMGLQFNLCDVLLLLIDKLVLFFCLFILVVFEMVFVFEDLCGQVWLFNVWVLWCVVCQLEYLVFMDLVKISVVLLIGLNYKDKCQLVLSWLGKYGNLYKIMLFDVDGCVGLDFGVYGVFEIYVIDKQGMICMKFIGLVMFEVVCEKLLLLINEFGV